VRRALDASIYMLKWSCKGTRLRPCAEDITSQKRSEKELRRTALELRLLIETANAPIVGRASRSIAGRPSLFCFKYIHQS